MQPETGDVAGQVPGVVPGEVPGVLPGIDLGPVFQLGRKERGFSSKSRSVTQVGLSMVRGKNA